MRKIGIVLGFVILAFSSHSQSVFWNWSASINGPSNEDEIDALASDSEANAYISGKFEDTLFLDNFNDTLVSYGMADIMLVKYDSTGQMLWYRHYGGTGEDNVFDADCDGNDHVILSGYFQDTLVFDEDTLIAHGGFDAFFVKLDPDGDVIWAKSYGGIGDEGSNEVSIGLNNQIISSIDSDGDFMMDALSVTNTGNRDTYLVSISSDGNVEWYRGIEGSGEARSKSITVDAWGNIYFGGDFYGTNSVIDENTIGHALTFVGNKDAYLTRWDKDGNFKWAKSWGGSGFEYCKGLATDSYGYVYASGPFENTVSFNGTMLTSDGGIDFFLWRMDSLGNSIWLHQIKSAEDVLEGGELIADGQDGVAFGVGMTDDLTFTTYTGDQVFNTTSMVSNPLFVHYNSQGELVHYLETVNSVYGTTGEISRSGNYFFLDIVYAGLVDFGNHSVVSEPTNNKDGALASIYIKEWTNVITETIINNFKLYPNPTKEILFIDGLSDTYSVEISDVSGHVFHRSNAHFGKSSIALNYLPSGVYLVKVQLSNEVFVKSIVKY